MKVIAVALAVLGAGALSGCGGMRKLGGRSLDLPSGEIRVRGADVWAEVGQYFQGDYRENDAIKTQKHPAPHDVGEPEPGATRPLTFEGAAENLLIAVESARKFAEGRLTYKEVGELEPRTARILFHARELVKAVEERARSRRIAAMHAPAKAASAAPEGGRLVRDTELIELNALRLWRAAATHSKSNIVEWWRALLSSCKGLSGEWVALSRAEALRHAGLSAVAQAGAPDTEEPPAAEAAEETTVEVEEAPVEAVGETVEETAEETSFE